MKRAKLIISFFILSYAWSALAWGPTGHRVVAKIASVNLTQKASKAVYEILGKQETLEMAATWPDFVRSDDKYAKSYPWHYVSIDDPKKGYDIKKRNPEGDVIWAIEHFIQELKRDDLTAEQKREPLRYLIHFVGDIHQPLHVGLTQDRGGNSIPLKWFGKKSNLHEIWDEKLIELQKLSYTEYVGFIDRTPRDEAAKWATDDIKVWARESMELRPLVYSYPKKREKYWEYQYNYKVIHELNKRLEMAGHRLAYVLNTIFH